MGCGMIATSLDDLQVYQQALDAAAAISPILARPVFERHPDLRRQLDRCSSRIPPLIAEGFGQKTDRHCAHFQYIARGSCNEMCAHLSVALGKGLITPGERFDLNGRYESIGKRLTRWIQHLEREDRKRR